MNIAPFNDQAFIAASSFGNVGTATFLTSVPAPTDTGITAWRFAIEDEPVFRALWTPPSDWDQETISIRVLFASTSGSGITGSAYLQGALYRLTASGVEQISGFSGGASDISSTAGSAFLDYTPALSAISPAPTPGQPLVIEASIINEDATGVDDLYIMGCVVTFMRTGQID